MITGVAHLCFRTGDLDRAIDFYVDKLGLTPGFDFINDDGVRFGKYIHVGQRTFIELFAGEIGEPAEAQTYQHFCLEVDDIEKTVAALRAGGVDVTDPKMGADHSWQAWLADPDGNRIELHQYTPDSKQGTYLG